MKQAANHFHAGMAKLKELDNKNDGLAKLKNMDKIIDEAFKNFSKAVLIIAEFAQAYYMRGKCYMHMTDYKRALYDFSSAILNQKHENKQPPGVRCEGLASYFSKPIISNNECPLVYAGMCNYYLG